ncbi:MAG TPA: rod-binding protein [Azospirillum sp.]|nr:rod-binding protein [Azospirillum sp.]
MNVTATPAVPAPSRPEIPAPAQRAARDFEAMMVSRMLESMFAGIDSGGPFGGGQAERTWRGFMLQEYGKAIAEAGTLGIGRMVESEVARLYAQQSESQG